MLSSNAEFVKAYQAIVDALKQNPELKADGFFFVRCSTLAEMQAFVQAFKHVGLTKEFTDTEVRVEGKIGPVLIRASIDRGKMCRIVTPAVPAVYDCEPILEAITVQNDPT